MNKLYLKHLLFSLVFIGIGRLWGQEQIGLKYNPATPTVAEMIKPNDIPVNESTGKIFPSIPLYTLTAGDIQVPISVTYNGNGIKVGQSPGILGYNWQLSYGGKVTRNLRDKADEEYTFINKSFHYYDSLRQINPSLIPQENSPYYQAIHELVPPSNIDTEKDIFQFELLGYSGSFMIFPVPGEAHMYEGKIIKGNQKVKIRYYVNFSDHEHNRTFYITLPNGITGIFGGKDHTTNLTKISPPIDMFHTTTSIQLPPSSFYLRKIISPKGDLVEFNYYKTQFDKNDILVEEKYKKITGNGFSLAARPAPINDDDNDNDNDNDNQNNDESEEDQDPDEDNPDTGGGGSDGGASNGEGTAGASTNNTGGICYRLTNQTTKFFGQIKIIQSIVSNNHDTISFGLGGEYLQSINIKHFSKNIINIYFKRHILYPKFLTKIYFQNAKENYYYAFEYYDIDRFPRNIGSDFKAIDYWGYYNGEDSNTALVKVFNPSILCRFQSGNEQYRCNREPDLESSQYGALKRIYYPTGGYKEFEYELPIDTIPARTELVTNESHLTVQSDTSMNEELSNILDSIAGSYIDTLSSNYRSIDYVDFNTLNFDNGYNVSFNLSLEGESTNSHVLSQLLVIFADITNNTLNNYHSYAVSVDFIGNNNNGNTHSNNTAYRTFEVTVDTGRVYRVLAIINGNIPDDANVYGRVDVTYKVIDTLSGNIRFLPGLRIKRIRTFNDSSSAPLIKRFYYNRLADYSTNYFLEAPSLDKVSYRGVISSSISNSNGSGNNSIGCQENYSMTHFLSSESKDKILIDDNNRRLYPYVTISLGGDHFEQGAIEKHFHVEMGNFYGRLIGDMVYAHYGGNEAWMNGTLTNEIVFNRNLDTIKMVEHFYKIDTSKSVRTYNYIIENKLTGDFCLPNQIPLDNMYNIAKYTTDAWWISEDSTVTTEYFPTGKVVTWTKNYYDSHYAGMPDRVRTADSKGNILESRTYYPGTALTGLDFHSAEDSDLANRLYQLHRLTSVLQQEQYLNGNLLSASRIGYHHWTDNNNGIRITEIIQPDSIWQKKQGVNDWDLQTIAYRYDDKGHLLEASKGERGTHVFFLYGYHNTKIIAVLNFVPCKDDQVDCGLPNNGTVRQAINDAITKSDIDDELGTEDSERELRQALSTLHRVVSDLHSENYRIISAYTYDPPIGMTGKMDEKGDWSTYHYDLLGRLQYIKDKDGNIRKEYQYNYIQSDY